MRLFDLNIETVLEHWECEHGLREIIAIALDERTLTSTPPINIENDDQGRWHIRDFGRGIRIEHFTLNENLEKIGANGVIGKFGVGLKDALATLDRHHATVSIRSQHGFFTLTKASKHDYHGISTLHISHETGDKTIIGTDVIISNIPDAAIDKAKSMFLYYREHCVLESTEYGQIIEAGSSGAEVFINGVWVNAEPTFLFSYNVTSLTESMRKALNRERVSIGRSVYADRLRLILKKASTAKVLQSIAAAYARRDEGELLEEITWIEIAHKALNELSKNEKIVIISRTKINDHPELVEDIKSGGNKIILVTDKEMERAEQQAEQGAAPFMTLHTWKQFVKNGFQYRFVDENMFTENEITVWEKRFHILELVGIYNYAIPRIYVSETLCNVDDGTCGVWDETINAIIIKRSQLRSLLKFAGTLLHELAHAITGAYDCTRLFENTLTEYLGKIAAVALSGFEPSVDRIGKAKNIVSIVEPEVYVKMDDIYFVSVGSSYISRIGYDDMAQTLYVEFSNGSNYVYLEVEQAIHTAFINAESKGRYFKAEIIGRYKYKRI